MKIVVLDGYTENPGDLSWDGIAALGDLTVYDRTSLTDESEIAARIGEAEVGCGNIGVHTAAIAKALGMHVITYDGRQNETALSLGVEYVSLDELFARSDVLGLQMPLFPFNTGIINKENIAKMKDGVIIINNSRGQMVVEQDLADALNSGKVAAAGLDVVSTEPIRGDNPLLKAKNCILTPHISWAPKESRQRIMECSVDNLKAYLAGKPINVVNP